MSLAAAPTPRSRLQEQPGDEQLTLDELGGGSGTAADEAEALRGEGRPWLGVGGVRLLWG